MRSAPSAAHRRRRTGVLVAVAIVLAAGIYVSVGAGRSSSRAPAAAGTTVARSSPAGTPARVQPSVPPPPPVPRLVVAPPRHTTAGWRVAALVHGVPAAWIAERSGVTLMRFDQSLVHLTLHAGSNDGGTVGWRYGDSVTRSEIHLLVAAFNGGFKLTYGNVGFVSGGHVAAPLASGRGSIVTYTDGTTAIGAWNAGVPSSLKTVYSVLQNQNLLVDRGTVAGTATSCILSCFGATIGDHTVVARSGLGISQDGQLIWAAGTELTPAGLGRALVAAGAVRAVELDINPFWVAGYLYPHHPGGPTPVPVIPGQHGVAGEFLEANTRDFFTIVAN